MGASSPSSRLESAKGSPERIRSGGGGSGMPSTLATGDPLTSKEAADPVPQPKDRQGCTTLADFMKRSDH